MSESDSFFAEITQKSPGTIVRSLALTAINERMPNSQHIDTEDVEGVKTFALVRRAFKVRRGHNG